MSTISREEEFEPHFVYHKDIGMLQAIFLDRASEKIAVSSSVDILVNANSASRNEPIVGFNLYGVLGVLHAAGKYHQKSITLQVLVRQFDKKTFVPHGRSVFGLYHDEVCELVRKHNLVWKIPK